MIRSSDQGCQLLGVQTHGWYTVNPSWWLGASSCSVRGMPPSRYIECGHICKTGKKKECQLNSIYTLVVFIWNVN